MNNESEAGGRAPRPPLTDEELERVRQAELEWFNFVEEDARRSVDSGIILRMIDELRALRSVMEFALSDEGGFACPEGTYKKMLAALGRVEHL